MNKDEYLMQLWEILGPFPSKLKGTWRRVNCYYGDDDKLRDDMHGPVVVVGDRQLGEKDWLTPLHPSESLEVMFCSKRPDIKKDEARQILGLIRWALQYDPTKRPSAAELTRHPWLSSAYFS